MALATTDNRNGVTSTYADEQGVDNGKGLAINGTPSARQLREDVPDWQASSGNFPSEEKHPRWVSKWRKFRPDGRMLRFPGHAVICHLPPESALYHALLDLHSALKTQDFASLYGLLPPKSWHMTIFEGVSDQIREPGYWPADLAMDATLDECTTHVRTKLTNFELGADAGPPYRMVVDGFEPLEDGIALKIVAADSEEEKRLRHLRNRLSELYQVRHPGHATFSFHMGLSYMLRYLSPEESDRISVFLREQRLKLPVAFELPAPPEFCVFDDMSQFNRQFYLK